MTTQTTANYTVLTSPQHQHIKHYKATELCAAPIPEPGVPLLVAPLPPVYGEAPNATTPYAPTPMLSAVENMWIRSIANSKSTYDFNRTIVLARLNGVVIKPSVL